MQRKRLLHPLKHSKLLIIKLSRDQCDNIYNDIAHLSSEPRVAGTEAQWNAVQYIKSKFSSFGYCTEIQPFTFESYQAPKVFVTVAGDTLSSDSFTYTPDGKYG